MERRYGHSAHWGAFTAVVRDGRLVAAEPVAEDPDPSPILRALPGMVQGHSRVRRPSVRRGWLEHGPGGARDRRGTDEWVALPWDEVLDRIAAELKRQCRTHGNGALFSGSYGWCSAGRLHHAKSHLQRFMNLLGGSAVQVHSYSFAAAQTLLPRILGDAEAATGPVSSWDGIVAHTRLMVCFGGVPLRTAQVESGGCGRHETAMWLRAARDAGVRFINIGPLQDDLPDWLLHEWIPIRPGTDTALLLAMAQELLAAGRHDSAFLASHCTGFEVFARYLTGDADGQPKTPAWAEAVTGVPAARIARLAHEMADTRSMLAMAWALQRAEHGEQPFWAAIALAAMLGQIGLPGGGFGFGYGAEAGMGAPRQRIANPTFPQGRNPLSLSDPLNHAIPVARIADMLLHPGESYEYDGETRRYPDARLVWWCGGNPFHHHQDLNRLADAFRRPETIIVNECYWTATARHADIVLPATTTLERDDIGASVRDRTLVAMKRAIDPVGDARDDFAIFADLAVRFGLHDAYTEGRDAQEWLRHIYATARDQAAARRVKLPDFGNFWAAGRAAVPAPAAPYTMLGDFRADPQAHPLATPSGRIEIFSETIAGFGYPDCPGHPTWLAPVEALGRPLARRFPLHLLSNQPETRLHSQMDAGGVSLETKIQGREPLRIHPADAAARGIAAGDILRVFNDRGAMLAGAVLTGAVMPGVVVCATGAWFDPDPVLALEVHGNPNVLTRDAGTSRLSQGCTAQSCLVEVERWTGPLPPLRCHTPPLPEIAR